MSDKDSNIGAISLVILVIGVFTVALIKTPMSVLFGGSTTVTEKAAVDNHIKSTEVVNPEVTPQSDTETPVQSTEIKAESEKVELVVPGICIACHGTGVLGAPKIGDKSAWEVRAKQGLDALINSASKGKGNMPPQGASFNNDQLKEAIEAMLSKSGLGE